jgi:hypothetical protein
MATHPLKMGYKNLKILRIPPSWNHEFDQGKGKTDKTGLSIYDSLSKGEDEVHGHEKASKRLASLQAMSPATARRYAALPPDFTRDKV